MFVFSLLLSILPTDGIVRERVDAIEINNYYSPACEDADPIIHKLVFQQVIFRNWNDFYCEHEIAAWRMSKPGMEPRFDHARKLCVVDWVDSGTHRRVEATTMHETFTEFDPEVDERKVLPNEQRRGLIRCQLNQQTKR